MLSFLATFKPAITQTIDTFLAAEEKRLATISRPAARLTKECRALAVRGKMVRGSLACLGYTLKGKTVDQPCLAIAAAIELAHTALLVHDDIMDGDTLRRGEPAVHAQYALLGQKEKMRNPKRFGEGMATCLADMAFFWSFNLATQAFADEPELIAPALTILTQELAAVGAAQAQDLWSGNHTAEPTLATIISTYRHKTARYTFSLPLMLGLLAARADSRTIDALSAFGEHIGIVFQIRDDALGLFGNEDQIGKPVGSDIREGKKTLYHHFLFRLASPSEKKRLRALFGNPNLSAKDLAFVRSMTERHDIEKRIARIARKELSFAHKALTDAGLTREQHAIFQSLADYISERAS